ncbi:MAG: hypothetical protein ACYC36_03440 [Bellilinea sp.]
MVTDKDIAEAGEREELLAEAYLKGLIDFVKWSSTLAVAAILWIGNFITSATGLSWAMSALSLVLLIVSLVVAIFAARRVLIAWAKEWEVARADHAFSLFKKFKAIKTRELKLTETARLNELDKQEQDIIERLIKSIDSAKPFSESKRFNTWISWHIILLIGGLLVYIVAQFLGVL